LAFRALHGHGGASVRGANPLEFRVVENIEHL